MRTTRWQPFHPLVNPLQQFHGEVNRLLDQWIGGGSPLATATSFPPVNIWEEGDNVHIEAELPGLDARSLEVLVSEGNQLTIKGEQTKTAPEQGVWHRQERRGGNFSRTVALPFL